MEHLTHREHAGEEPEAIQKDILQWVKTNTKGSWVQINDYRYNFLRKGDAMFFKLAWG